MTSPTPGAVTQLLARAQAGNTAALEELVPLVYAELRRIAGRYVRRERAGHSLQATALVHEAYIRLLKDEDLTFENRAHFLGIAARSMRQILVEHARARNADKRGGERQRVTLDEGVAAGGPVMSICWRSKKRSGGLLRSTPITPASSSFASSVA